MSRAYARKGASPSTQHGSGGVCAQGRQPEHIAGAKARIERQRNRAPPQKKPKNRNACLFRAIGRALKKNRQIAMLVYFVRLSYNFGFV